MFLLVRMLYDKGTIGITSGRRMVGKARERVGVGAGEKSEAMHGKLSVDSSGYGGIDGPSG